MINLESQLTTEKQPYYEIIGAFNALGLNDIDGFEQKISDSFIKCTDEQLLELLEIQYLSYLATKNGISSTVIGAINKGLMYEKKEPCRSRNNNIKKHLCLQAITHRHNSTWGVSIIKR